jgi:hypothetical protein
MRGHGPFTSARWRLMRRHSAPSILTPISNGPFRVAFVHLAECILAG